MTNQCGGCTACCTIMRVNDKPARCECPFAVKHGCTIYDVRPTVCRDWACVWRFTQDDNDLPRMASALRPDRSGVVLEPNSMGNIVAHCRRPNDWRMEPMRSWLIAAAQRTVVLLEFGDGLDPVELRADGSLGAIVATGSVSPEGNREYRRA